MITYDRERVLMMAYSGHRLKLIWAPKVLWPSTQMIWNPKRYGHRLKLIWAPKVLWPFIFLLWDQKSDGQCLSLLDQAYDMRCSEPLIAVENSMWTIVSSGLKSIRFSC